jgi:hypothetical protein
MAWPLSATPLLASPAECGPDTLAPPAVVFDLPANAGLALRLGLPGPRASIDRSDYYAGWTAVAALHTHAHERRGCGGRQQEEQHAEHQIQPDRRQVGDTPPLDEFASQKAWLEQ